MADDTDAQIAAAVAGITGPATPDPKGLFDLAASIRAQIARADSDPTSIYHKRPDLAAQAEQNIRVTMARAGVTEPVFDPLAAASAAHAASFTMGELNPNLAELVDDRLGALTDTYSEERLAEMAGQVRKTLGSAAYDKMIEEATTVLNPGEKLPPAVKADLLTLRLLASHGRYNAAYERTKPRSVTP
jgi:hypothetical protein